MSATGPISKDGARSERSEQKPEAAFSGLLSQVGKIAEDSFSKASEGASGVLSSAADFAGNAANGAFEMASGAFEGIFKSREQEIKGAVEDQDEEAVDYAIAFLKELLRLRGVRVDRGRYLEAELRKKGISGGVIRAAIETRPAEADISEEILDEIARETIAFETRKSTALSFAAGLPGGFALLGTIPADLTQYYVHAFRIMQKLAYLYGWSSFLEDCKEVDDETLALLGSFFGVMLGIAGASQALGVFAAKVVAPSIEKRVASMALTKTMWYGPLKSTLRFIGVSVTKQSVGKAASKVVPVLGGVISGGMTFISLNAEAGRLREHLAGLPPAKPDSEIVFDNKDSGDELCESS